MKIPRNPKTQKKREHGSAFSWLILLFLVLLSLKFTNQRVASVTQYDGITMNSAYNTPLKFVGNTGLVLKDISTINSLTAYTLSIWFRLQADPQALGRSMSLITAKNQFECLLTSNPQMRCKSDSDSQQFQIDGSVRLYNWYILVLRAKSKYSQIQIRELSYTLFSSDTSTSRFFPFGKTSLTVSQFIIGIDEDFKNNDFIGNIRNLKLLSTYNEDAMVQKYQYVYLYATRTLAYQAMMDDLDDLNGGQLVGKTASLTKEFDFAGVYSCFSPQEWDFVEFKPSYSMPQVTISNDYQSTSLQMWVYRKSISSSSLSNDEVLFEHQDLLKLSITLNDYNNLQIVNQQHQDLPLTLSNIPKGRWVFIQVLNSDQSLKAQAFEIDGYQIDSEETSYSAIGQGGSTVTIGRNFNGYMHGIKYFKSATPSSSGMHTFRASTNSNALMYYIFTNQSLSSGRFRNYGTSSGAGGSISSSGVSWTRSFKAPAGDKNGTTNTDLLFDGYTCSDQKQKLRFTSKTSYVSTQIDPSGTLNNYAIEFWVKPNSKITGSAVMLSISELIFNRQIYGTIYQDGDNALYCSPQYTVSTTRQTVKYSDYANDAMQWMHVSCVYDGDNLLLKGFLFYDQVNQAYYTQLVTTATLPRRTLTLTVNTNPSSDQEGVADAFFAEIRFWNDTRSQSEITNNRFQQLNIENERPSLFAYLKLVSNYQDSSQSPSIRELDYGDWRLQSYATINQVSWTTNSDNIICPLGMFRGDVKDPQCYREGIITFQLVVYKTDNSYVISSFYQRYRSYFVRDYAKAIYDYQWTLDSVDSANSSNARVFPSYFSPQITKQQLEFRFDQVSNRPGKYGITLQMTDKRRQQQVQKGSIAFKTYKCANIFDRDSLDSFVYKDMDSNKGEQDAVFYYQYTECADYKFDQNSMTFTIETTSSLQLSTGDHDQDAKSFTLRKAIQSSLPLNDYFYFKIKGVWKNTKDSTDIIEYYLIFACRYISKLVVSLSPSAKLMLKGQTLTIDFTAKFYNMKQVTTNDAYTISWTCPSLIQDVCSSQSGQLKINYQAVLNSGLAYWKAWPITLTAQTNFLQGDGVKFSNRTVKITWIDVTPDSRMYLNNVQINRYNNLNAQVDINSLKEDEIDLLWSSNPSVNSSCLINSNNRKQYAINKNCLVQGQSYNLTVRLIYSQYQQQIWQSSVVATIPRNPFGGRLLCSPSTLNAYVDTVRCTASGWSVSQSPAKYQFFVVDSKTGAMNALTSLRTSGEFIGQLPNTTQVAVKIVDGSEAYTISTTSVSSTYSDSSQVSTQISRLFDLAETLKDQPNAHLMQNLTWITNALVSLASNSTSNETALSVANLMLYQAQKLNSFSSQDNKRFFVQGVAQINNQITNSVKNINFEVMSKMQTALASAMNQTEIIELLYTDSDFQRNLFTSQSNILSILKQMKDRGEIKASSNTTDEDLNTITLQLRWILVKYEQYISTRLYEGESFVYNTSQFNFSVKKYSRMADVLQNITQSITGLSYQYPLENAKQPTTRQTFTSITFKTNPFIGYQQTNQSATSDASIYFAYRDEFGNYLDGSNIIGNIKMVYKFQYSPLIFLPNTTVCGYTQVEDAYWENKSCSTQFSREQGTVTCYCKHMSYYSIIDDYLVRPQRIPLIQLLFKNWASFIVLLYLLMAFIIGFIYTYNKDNQDFRYLHNLEEQQNNELLSDDSVGLVSLAFKRKVFFMDFSEKFRFRTLYKIYMMLLHPIFQLKYKMDPEVPRFYRFLLLYTRIVIMFGISFFILKDFKNPNDAGEDPTAAIITIVVYSLAGSLIFVPMPIWLLQLVRSRYFLLNPQAQKNKEFDIDDPNPNGEIIYPVSDVAIDTNIPIKLLFLVNAVAHEKLEKEYGTKQAYASGNLIAVGKKLFELDIDAQKKVQEEEAEAKERKEEIEREKNQQNVTPTERHLNNHDHENLQTYQDSKQTQRDQHGQRTERHRKSSKSDMMDIKNDNSKLNQTQQVQSRNTSIINININNQPYDSETKANKNNKFATPTVYDLSNTGLALQPQQQQEEEEEIRDEAKDRKRKDRKERKEKKKHRKNKKERRKKRDQDADTQQYRQDEENGQVEESELERQTKKREIHFEGGDLENQQLEFEGGDREKTGSRDRNQNGPQQQQQQKEEGGNGGAENNNEQADEEESNFSIDTNLFIDEKKELVEERNFCGRLIFNGLAICINGAIIVSMLTLYVTEDYYNNSNPYVWVLAFFGCQIVGFFITDMVALLIIALIVTKWCSAKKVSLALFMREALYIYEDYKYVVQFVQTKIS